MKKMSKVLMKGNEAFAESCIRAGCRFFSGYPITPQTEILEYMSWRMEEVGGAFIQTESELAGVNMAFGAASAGAPMASRHRMRSRESRFFIFEQLPFFKLNCAWLNPPDRL